MSLVPYLAKMNQEISLLFNRTDFVKRDGSTIFINKGAESRQMGEVSFLYLNFLEDYSLIFQYFGFKLYPISFKWPETRTIESILETFSKAIFKFSQLGPHYEVLVKVCAHSFCQPPLHRQNSGYTPDEKGELFNLFSFRGYHSSQICMNIKSSFFRFQY